MKLDISVAIRRNQKKWLNKKISWEDLAFKLSNTQRTSETFREYLRASKTLQSQIKDVGGFVGGYLRQGKRSISTVEHRQIVTLDIDESPLEVDELVDRIRENIPYEFLIYSTHKHAPERPRLRVVIPLDRPVDPDQYEAIARYIAGEVNIDFFDPTTFQPSRFMYWPSTSSDGEFYFTHEEFSPVCCADDVLGMYLDWKDITAWPRLSTETPEIVRESKQLGEPTEKDGVIGAFCRAYTAEEAIDTFLTNVYRQEEDGRYTYLDGSTSGGGVLYSKGTFFFSHHSTDPASGKLLNAFDLVRLHKFGGLDRGDEKNVTQTESFKSMCDFALKDSAVRAELDDVERPLSKALLLEFEDELSGEDDWLGGPLEDIDKLFENGEALEVDNVPDFYKPEIRTSLPGGIDEDNWKDSLERVKKTGEIMPTITNIKLIIIFDPDLKGKIALNDFESVIFVTGALKWNPDTSLRRWDDNDMSGLRELMETKYGISSNTKVKDGLVLAAMFNRFHPVKSFLENLPEWDGRVRLDSLFIDYLGAEDTAYTRAATRKSFVAAIARVMKPGCKFDYVTTLVGPEGLKKSSMLNEMGGRWFSDSFTTVEGTKAFEQLQGSWLIEIAELSAFNRSEVNAIKSFVTKKHDKFRAAYKETTQDIPRQCVFFATTNDYEFLKGTTGNRRFWPIHVTKKYTGAPIAGKSGNGAEIILGLPVQQLWAEALHYYKKGEKLYLDEELEKDALAEQNRFTESDARLGKILEFLEADFPENWENMSKFEKKDFVNSGYVIPPTEEYTIKLDAVCTLELWEICLGIDPRDYTKYKSKDINALVRQAPGWERTTYTKLFTGYGHQLYFKRTKPTMRKMGRIEGWESEEE